ncbi:lysine exporter LysO family protein [uncultured Coprobacter sp.]|uniref:lysine exporter LysO family protein n=1 Tax=uncultured Coprobacter sp. TaxID=1720550 RepID=UPI00262B3257|nr:lysine exporter LysO family protein [uncultured Coprobacter sp.]
MKSSFIILCCFITGILLAYYRCVPDIFLTHDYSNYILPIMMFFVGIGIGGDIKSLYVPIKKYKIKIILIPLATIFGSIIITALISPLFDITTKETIAIGSGFGYYSLSAIFLNKLAGYEIGMMALISNMTREITALLFIPILARYCGKLAPISAAGATSIDTTLPIIAKSCGEQFIVISIFHGIFVDISVPVIISLLYY